jgi:glutamate formiminotransferase
MAIPSSIPRFNPGVDLAGIEEEIRSTRQDLVALRETETRRANGQAAKESERPDEPSAETDPRPGAGRVSAQTLLFAVGAGIGLWLLTNQ